MMILKLLPKITNNKFLPISRLFRNKSMARVSYIGQFSFGIFKRRENYEQIITLNIKNARNALQIDQIIKTKQQLFNIVHLTAILDRVEELDLPEKKKFVEYTVQQLKKVPHFFFNLKIQKVRTISNLICYLGNMQNKEMNEIFQQINYNFMFRNANKTQIVMLITGLMRLKLFENIIDIDSDKDSSAPTKAKIPIERVINSEFQFYHILSIWYAFLTKISSTNIRINNHINKILSSIKSLQVNTLERYTYLVFCFTKAYKNHTQENLIKLSHAVFNHSFKYQEDKKYCTAYQFSLLMVHMKQAQLLYTKSIFNPIANKQNCNFVQFWQKNKDKLINILQQNFVVICKNPHVTLRNIANCMKFYDDLFPTSKTILTNAYYTFIKVFQAESNNSQKDSRSKTNGLFAPETKIDFLSFCSLIYSFSEKVNFQDKNLKYDVNLFISLISCYIKQVKKSNKFSEYQNKQILLLYSSIYRLTKLYKVYYDSEIQSISIDEVTSGKRQFSLKEITFIYAYFKTIHFDHPKLCEWLKRQITKKKIQNEIQFKQNRVAKKIISFKKCLVGNPQNCLRCFENEQKKFFTQRNNQINVKKDAIN